jgi:phosphatidylglycerol:prolipoprotein diacylglycerol transferase
MLGAILFPFTRNYIDLGIVNIHYYALAYVLSFILGMVFYKKNLKYRGIEMDKAVYENLMFYIMLGVILGGRFGYVLFYNLSYYISHPVEILWPFRDGHFVGISGMSFHGGALGVILLGLYFCRRYHWRFYQLADPVMPYVALGLGLGRLGNFVNGELFGRPTSLPWGMIFPDDELALPRHPSQLYEAFGEGFLMFAFLQILLRKTKREGLVFYAFIAAYGIVRFLIEFVRQPDPQLGFVVASFTQGQILSSFMILAGIIGLIYVMRRKPSDAPVDTPAA